MGKRIGEEKGRGEGTAEEGRKEGWKTKGKKILKRGEGGSGREAGSGERIKG